MERYCWICRGQDIESAEILRQGFTHAFLMTFGSKEDFSAFAGHPNHLQFSATFSSAIDKAILLDFPAINVKPAAAWVEPINYNILLTIAYV